MPRFYFPFRPGTYNEKWERGGTDFGRRTSPISGKIVSHGGIDIGAEAGTDVLALKRGVVRGLRLDHHSAGTYITIEHAGDYWSRYLHLREPLVEEGDKVRSEQVIALSGGVPGEFGSGNTTGPHLHLELWKGEPYKGGERLDPTDYLREARKKGAVLVKVAGVAAVGGLLFAALRYRRRR